MAKTYNKMQIDMNGDILSSVTAVAQDTLSRYLDCSLYNNGVTLDLTGHMAQLYIKKPEPDGLTVLTQGEITDAAAGRVQFELTNQALAETGWIELQIVLTSGEGEVLSSEIFKLHVLPSIRSDEAIESTNEFGALVVLFQEIQNSLDLMKAIVENFGKPGEVAVEYGATTFWEILEAVVGRVDVVSLTKEYINGMMGESHCLTLDKLLGAKIVCRGNVGTKFVLTRTDGYYPAIVVEITEDAQLLSDSLRAVVVPVPCGEYTVTVDAYGYPATVTVNAAEYGQHYTFSYDAIVEIARFTANGTFTVPADADAIFVTAAAGGGAGAGGTTRKLGGGAGGGGDCIIAKEYPVTPNETMNIQVGVGGKAGEVAASGTAGTATVIGNLVTLAGGSPGLADGTGGAPGGEGGGKGGDGGIFDNGATVKDAQAGEPGAVGKGGDPGLSGGGGGSLGPGGNGCVPFLNDPEPGVNGSGGSGGAPSGTTIDMTGADGGDGIVIIYKGVRVA